MSTPHFLTSSHRYFRRQGVTDVQTIMDDFYAETVTHGGWSDQGAGKLRSPNTDGRWMDITLARAAINKLNMTLGDQTLGFYTICARQAQGVAAHAWDVRIFTGQFHAYIDIISDPLNAECVYAGILDMWPDSPFTQTVDYHPTVYGNGSRTTVGVYTAADNDVSKAWMRDQVSSCQMWPRVGILTGGSSTDVGVRTLELVRSYHPREFWASGPGQVLTGSYFGHYAGRAYNTLFVDGSLTPGSELYISVDAGFPVRFVTIAGIPVNWGRMLAVRAD